MNWNKGFSAQYYVNMVDPATWRDLSRVEIIGGDVSRSIDDLRVSASFDVLGWEPEGEAWVRIWLDAKQGEDAEHMALFTGLATSPARQMDGVIPQHTIDCFSVLKPAADVLLPRGWYAPSGLPAGDLLTSLLAVTPAPVVIDEGIPALTEPVIAEDGESNLTMVNKILTATGWRLRIAGDGTIEVAPPAIVEAASFDPLSNDVVEPEIEITRDWYNCPNVFRAVMDKQVGIARDEDPGSPLSTVSRGREIWMQEQADGLGDNETIAEYAVRRLKEAQQVATVVQYARRYMPDVIPGDLVALRYPAQGLEGLYTITDQSIELGYGAQVSETVQR